MSLRITALVIPCMILSSFAHATPLLKDGDRMVFIGDSITEQQIYTRYVMDYFALRYPGATIHFRNRGIAGATAGFHQPLYDSMMKTCRPTVASICFGMNDGHYKPFEQKAYDDYVASMTQWITALKKDHVRVLLMTPGCVDQPRKPDRLGNYYNDTLARLAEGVKVISAKEGVPVFDLHALMLGVQTRAQKEDPNFVMIPDGVHPGPAGHVLMMAGLLKLLECSEPPASLDIEVATARVAAMQCRVTNLKTSADAVTFVRTDDALPMAFDAEAATVLKYLPLPEGLNAYQFRVRGLAGGKWKLTVARLPIGTFTADELTAGVDLSMHKGPWSALALKIDTVNAELSGRYYQAWRGFSAIHFTPDVEPERAALVDRLLELLDNEESVRTRISPEERTWEWSLTREK